MNKPLKASVVIPTYNREEDLVRAIKSVLNQRYKNFELVIVDQTLKHSVKTKTFLDSINDSRFHYFLVSPPSLPAARNFSISKVKGDIIIFIDDDVVLDTDFIEEHVKAYTKKDVGGVAGKVRGPTEPESLALYKLTKSGKRIGSFNYTHDKEAMAARGCNMSFRVEVLKELGGFDTGYVGNAYREDTDMSFRVRRAGYKILFRSKASLTHYDAISGGCREQEGLFDNLNAYKNNFRFFYKNQPNKYILSFYLTHLLRIVPTKHPFHSIKRFYYVFKGSNTAKKELRHEKPQIIATELKD